MRRKAGESLADNVSHVRPQPDRACRPEEPVCLFPAEFVVLS